MESLTGGELRFLVEGRITGTCLVKTNVFVLSSFEVDPVPETFQFCSS